VIGMSDIERDVRVFLDENFVLDESAGPLAADASLTRQGVLDSMGVLELIAFLEERFGIVVPDEDTLPENLDSIERVVGYVRLRTASGRDP
jgi:acyl carrier protein